jgi:hypothetical protein
MQAFQQLFNSLAHAGVLRTTHTNFRVGERFLASQLELNKNGAAGRCFDVSYIF